MTVSDVVTAEKHYQLTGSGFLPEGEVLSDGKPLEPKPGSAIYQVLLSGLLCNDSSLNDEDGELDFTGDPTEIALLVSARKSGLQGDILNKEFPRIDTIPFDSRNRYMATMHGTSDGRKIVFIKGALEIVLSRCDFQLGVDGNLVPINHEVEIHTTVDSLASQGKRVLAFALKELASKATALDESGLQSGLIFLGMQAIIDPPRAEAAAAVAACQDAGISVKMITGDHPLTAAAIAHLIGIIRGKKFEELAPFTITGSDLSGFTDAELIDRVENYNVFSQSFTRSETSFGRSTASTRPYRFNDRGWGE